MAPAHACAVPYRIENHAAVDVRARAIALSPRGRSLSRLLAVHYPLGMPGGFLPIAHGLAHILKQRGRRGGGEIIAAAWIGWLGHRAAKLFLERERPYPSVKRNGERKPRRTDSFPSG